jgi:hypothetical protein
MAGAKEESKESLLYAIGEETSSVGIRWFKSRRWRHGAKGKQLDKYPSGGRAMGNGEHMTAALAERGA